MDIKFQLILINSHEWPKQNFSLQYQYNIKQTSDENIEKYQLGDYKLIQYQILQTNVMRAVWQTVRRKLIFFKLMVMGKRSLLLKLYYVLSPSLLLY